MPRYVALGHILRAADAFESGGGVGPFVKADARGHDAIGAVVHVQANQHVRKLSLEEVGLQHRRTSLLAVGRVIGFMPRSVFAHAYDIIEATAVTRFKAGGSADADYAAFIPVFLSLDKKVVGREGPILLAVVDPRHTPPNALWRKRIAAANKQLQSRATFIFVSESPFARGAMRAIAWMSAEQLTVRIAATFQEARVIAEAMRGKPLPSLVAMLEDVERKIALAEARLRAESA